MISPTPNLQELEIHRKRNWVATIVTVVVLSALGLFAWRVLTLAQQMRNGTISFEDFDSVNLSSSNLRLASIPLSDQPANIISLDDPSLGRTDAPVTIVEFADFDCPYSREASFTLREMALKYPEKIHYIYRDFPISDLHPIAQKAAEAGECAAEQGRFWEYHDKMYQNQSELSLVRLYSFASELNLNVNAFTECLDSGRKRDEVLEDYQNGLDAGVRGTPTFFINGTKIQGSIPKNILEKLILETL